MTDALDGLRRQARARASEARNDELDIEEIKTLSEWLARDDRFFVLSSKYGAGRTVVGSRLMQRFDAALREYIEDKIVVLEAKESRRVDE